MITFYFLMNFYKSTQVSVISSVFIMVIESGLNEITFKRIYFPLRINYFSMATATEAHSKACDDREKKPMEPSHNVNN